MVTFQPQADLLPQPSTPDGLVTFRCSRVHLEFSYGRFILHLGKYPGPSQYYVLSSGPQQWL